MPTIDQAKTALSQYLFQHSQDPNAPDFSLVTGLAIAGRNPETALPPEPGLPIKIAVPTETAFPPKIPAPTETVGPLKIPVPIETIAPIAATLAAEQIVVFVEDAPDCVLAPVEAALTAQAQGFPLLFLPTGRFEGLVAAGKSISCCAPAKFNLPELSAGTMGAVVKTPANNYALSSNHVLGFNGRASGVPVCRPGTLDEPNQPNVVGSVSTVVPMLPAAWPMWTPSTVNSVDAALALLASPSRERPSRSTRARSRTEPHSPKTAAPRAQPRPAPGAGLGKAMSISATARITSAASSAISIPPPSPPPAIPARSRRRIIRRWAL